MGNFKIVSPDQKKFKRVDAPGYTSGDILRLKVGANAGYKKYEEYLKRIQNEEYLTSDDLKGYEDAINSYTSKMDELRAYSQSMGHQFDDNEAWTQAKNSLTSQYKATRDYYSAFSDESQYKKALEDSKRYSYLQGLDLSTLEAEITKLQTELKNEAKKGFTLDISAGLPKPKHSDRYHEVEKLLNQKQKDYNEAKNIQDWNTLSTINDTNFDNYVNLGKNSKNSLELPIFSFSSNIKAETDRLNILAEHTTEEERNKYYYYVGKDETEKAERYLSMLEDEARKRAGSDIATSVKNAGKLASTFYSVVVGLDSFTSGMADVTNLLRGKDANKTSPIQYAGSEIRESLNSGWGIAYDVGQSIGNMLPSIALSVATGGAAIGTVAMGASAAGNAYSEMLKNGYSVNQSRVYGVLVGASEAALQYAIGGISPLGSAKGGVLSKATQTALSKVDKALARFAIEWGSSMASEAIEEGVQSILEPIFMSIATGEDINIDWEEVAYSALLGALTSGAWEGALTIAGTVHSNYKTNVQMGGLSNKGAASAFFKGNENGTKGFKGVVEAYKSGKQAVNENAKAYVKASLEIDSNNAHAQRMKSRLDNGKNISGYQLNRLAEANSSALSSKMKSTVEARLTELGEKGNVSKLADAIVKAQTGEKLTTSEKALFKKSEFAEQVLNEGFDENTPTQAQATTGQSETASATENSPVKENATEGKNSAVAKATMTDSEGNEVEVKPQKFALTESGEMGVEIDDGKVVAVSDVDFGDSDIGVVRQAAIDMSSRVGGFGVDTANVFVNGYNPESGQNAGEYINGWISAYKFGALDNPPPLSALATNPNTSKLTEEQRKSAYNFGKAFGKEAVANTADSGKIVSTESKNAENISKTDSKVKKGRVIFDGATYGKTLNERQRASLKSLTFLAKALGKDIYVEKLANGDNGWYDPKDRSIHIDLYAGVEREALMLFVAAHELTHDIREQLPDKFNILADAIFEEYTKKYSDHVMEDLVEAKTDFLKEQGDITEDMTEEEAYDLAYEEVICDCCETLLVDSNAMESLSKSIYAKDKGLWNAIKRFFVNLVERIKAAYKDVIPDTEEGQAFRELGEGAERIKNLWVEAIVELSEVGSEGREGTVKHSYSSIAYSFFGDKAVKVKDFENGSYTETEGYKRYVENCLNNMRQTSESFDEESARKEIEDSIAGIVKVAVAMKKAGYDILDNHAKRSTVDSKNRLLFSSLEPNSDYFTSSDISTICDKRINFAEIYDEIVRREEALGVPKGKRFFDNVDNYFILHKIMADKGLTQPCRECYVESMRKNLAPMANAFLKLMQETDPNNKANDQLWNKGQPKPNNTKLREKLLEAIETEEYDITADKLTVEMLTTDKGLTELRLQAPLIYEAFNSFYGQSKPKMPKSATPFRFGELTALLTDDNGNISKGKIDKIVSTGGFRLQSYSDFQIQNFADVLQVIFEAGTLGLNGHAYTKVPAFLDATKGTNLKRNISIFMYNDNGQWKIDRNDSFPYELDKIYDIVKSDKQGNTSIIAVSQNEMMSAWLMANDNIGYFIPFHKSGLKMGTVRETIVKEDGRKIKGYSGIKDHTRQQTEVWAKTTSDHKAYTKVKKGIDIYEFWDFDNVDNLSKEGLIEKNVRAYIDACEEAGYLPKFREYVINNSKVLNAVLSYAKELGFVSQNASVDDISFEYKGYRIPYGYYKCLGDFGMFTPDGEASPIERLSLKDYDFDEAEAFFTDAETLRRNEILQQIANGEERERYRNSDMTTAEISEEVQAKRNQVVDEVVSGEYKKVKHSHKADEKANFSDRDTSYLDAVNRGDMVTAQRMVDEAAKKAGYAVKGLHATNAEFTVFDIDKTSENNFHGKGIYFTNSERDLENNYENYEGPDPWQKIEARAYELVYDKYGISYEDTLTSDSEIIDKLNECYDIAIDEFRKSGRRITAYLRFDNPLILEKGMQIPYDYSSYDGIIDKQVYENIGHSGMDENTIHYVVLNPNNIKSADTVTYDDNGNIIPLSERFNPKSNDIRYQHRQSNGMKPRTLLANALESAAQNDVERNKLKQYKEKIDLLHAEEEKLHNLNEQIKELSFKKGPRDTKAIKSLQFEANQTANRINTYDRQLFNLESTKALKGVLEREKAQARKRAEQKGKEALERARERAAKTQRELMDRYQESRKKATEGRNKTAERVAIKALKEKFIRMLSSPTDRQYVPESLVKAMIEVCQLIDTDTPLYKKDGSINKAQQARNDQIQKLLALRDEYANLSKHPDPMYKGEFDEEILQYLDELRTEYSGKPIADMTLVELKELRLTLRSIDETLRDARKLIGWGEAELVYDAGDRIIQEQQKITRDRKGKGESATKAALIDNTLSPLRNVDRMSGYDANSPLNKAMREIELGNRKKNKFGMDAHKSFDEVISGKNVKKYEEAIYLPHGKEYIDKEGRKFRISKMQKMQAIMSYDRELANSKLHHVSKGGFTFADLGLLVKGKLSDAVDSKNAHSIMLGAEIAEEFRRELANDTWAQEYMKVAEEFFDVTAKNAINETNMTLKHRIIATGSKYIPYEVNKDFIVREINSENDIQQTISGYGMLKDLQEGAAQPIIITGLNNVLERHIDQVSNIVGLAVPIRNFNKIWNVKASDGSTTVQEAIGRNWGNRGKQVITQAVKDVQGSRISHTPAIYKKIKSNVVGATFMLNGSVVMKQTGSLFSATAKMRWRNPVSMLANLVYTMANHKKIAKEVDTYTASAWMRRQGMSESELSDFMTEAKKRGIARLMSKLPAVINPTKWVMGKDYVVALSLWKYAKQDVAKKTGLEGEALLKATAEYYDDIIEHTQSMSDSLHRPEIQKSDNILSETFGMFKTDLYQGAGLLLDAAGAFKAHPSKENAKALAKAVTANLMSALWASMITSAFALLRYKVNRYRDDEDDELTAESWIEEQGAALASDLVGYIVPLFGSELADIIMAVINDEPIETFDSFTLDAINNIVTAINRDDYTGIITTVCSMFGVPAANIKRVIEAVKLHAEDFANGELFEFEAGLTEPNSTRLYNAYIENDPDKIEKASRLYDDEKDIDAALRKALRENDPRIQSIITSLLKRDYKTSKTLSSEFLQEGHFNRELIEGAIEAEFNYVEDKIKEIRKLIESGKTEEIEGLYKKLKDRGYDLELIKKLI